MDPRDHARFLEYLEMYPYFRGGADRERLDREEWLAYDADLRAIEAKARAETATAEELARMRALRRLLLRD